MAELSRFSPDTFLAAVQQQLRGLDTWVDSPMSWLKVAAYLAVCAGLAVLVAAPRRWQTLAAWGAIAANCVLLALGRWYFIVYEAPHAMNAQWRATHPPTVEVVLGGMPYVGGVMWAVFSTPAVPAMDAAAVPLNGLSKEELMRLATQQLPGDEDVVARVNGEPITRGETRCFQPVTWRKHRRNTTPLDWQQEVRGRWNPGPRRGVLWSERFFFTGRRPCAGTRVT